MKRQHFALVLTLASAVIVAFICSHIASINQERPQFERWERGHVHTKKVLLDADVVDCFDDGFAMMMLEKDPRINLMGVTTVSGNSWSREGVASAIYQLQSIGATDVPVFMGERFPFREGRQANIKSELESYGLSVNSHIGSFSHNEPTDWEEYFKATYSCEPQMEVQEESAVDFIIRTIHENPNEITIVSIGPSTNLTKAILKDSTIVPLVNEIVCMGGAFFVEGNITQNAEFNVWFDPEAANFLFHQPFNKMTLFGLDVCNKVKMDKERFDQIHQLIQNENIRSIYEKNFLFGIFASNPNLSWCIWDLLAAAAVINPNIITESETCPITVDTTFGMTYGKTIPYRENAPADAQEGIIVKSINTDQLWRMVERLMKSL